MDNDIIKLHEFLIKIPRALGIIPDLIKAHKYIFSKPGQPLGLGWVLERAVRKNPDGYAILFEDRRITYRDFNAWANKFANYFIKLGIRKGDVAALLIENRPELLACVAGLAKTGAISSMLNTSLTGKLLTHCIDLVKPKMIIVGEELVKTYEEIRSNVKIPGERTYFIADHDTLKDTGRAQKNYINISRASKDSSPENPDTTDKIFKEDTCFFIYTSGTTGLPKAAIFTHGRVMKAYGGFGLLTTKLGPRDVMYVTLPFYHSTAMIMNWGPALVGAAGMAMRRKFSAGEFWNDVRKYNATCFGYVGELCRYLMNMPEKPNDADNPITSMVGTGLRPNIWSDFKNRFRIDRIFEAYASSEGPVGFINVLNFNKTVGIANDAFAVVKYDKETEKPVLNKKGFMQRVKKGEAGLLLTKINKKHGFDGYTDRGESNKILFTNALKKGDIWFNTGDSMRDIGFGHLQFVDRLGDTYRWKGENISTTEVENILNDYDNINEAVAYGVEIPNTNGRAGMASIVIDNSKEKINFKKLYEYLANVMPHYAIPVFLRIQTQMTTTGTYKYQKTDIKKEGYDINKFKDPVFVLLPGAGEYIQLTSITIKEINSGKYRF